ncbi:MAG: hypothetical protein VYE40_16435 [Myxococcota bacterium]|nr:hypothetical protein [Myxococcota bacterium]
MLLQVVIWFSLLALAATLLWFLFAAPEMMKKASNAVLEQAGTKQLPGQVDLLTSSRVGPEDEVDPWDSRTVASRVRAMREAGWSSEIDEIGRSEFYTYKDPGGAFTARLEACGYWHGALHEFALELHHASTHAAPDSFYLLIPDASQMLTLQRATESENTDNKQALFHTTPTRGGASRASDRVMARDARDFKISGYLPRASVRLEHVTLKGLVHPIYEQCFRRNTTSIHAPESPVVLTRVEIRGAMTSIRGIIRSPHSAEWALSGSLEQDREHVMRTSALLFADIGEALVWRGSEPRTFLAYLSSYEHQDDTLRQQARAQYNAILTPEQRREADFERVLDEKTPIQERGSRLASLIEHDPRGPLLDKILTASKAPEAVQLRRIIVEYGRPIIESKFRGPERTTWLNAYFGDHGGAPRELISTIARDITPASLLDPALSKRTREVLLGNLLHLDGDGYLGNVLEKLLEQSDEDQLIGLLRLIKEVGSRNTAEAVAKLAANPKQIDKIEEYIALLSAIRAFYLQYPDAFSTKEIEVFLCKCLEHPEERVAMMVPSLLETLGGAYTLMHVTRLIQTDARARFHAARLGKIISAIHARGGLDSFSGGLSLAEQQGGELTITGDKGRLTVVDS